MIKNEQELWNYVDQLVEGIREDYNMSDFDVDLDDFDIEDVIHQTVEGCEYVIYYNRAHSICLNCDIQRGESLVEEMGIKPSSYNDYASWVAYAELRLRVLDRFNIYY
jgi:hypothetical protein